MAEEAKSDDHPFVMVCIDNSVQSQQAFEWYANFIHRPGNKVMLVHCAELPHLSSTLVRNVTEVAYVSGEIWDAKVKEEKEKAQKLEHKFEELMKEKGISGKIKAVFGGKPGETLVEIANEEKVTFIVMGTRGLGTIRRTIMGSVSDYVVHHAHCPVLICRH